MADDISRAEILERLATGTHGGLVFGHGLGLWYNATKRNKDLKNYLGLAVHAVGLGYSLVSSINHALEDSYDSS